MNNPVLYLNGVHHSAGYRVRQSVEVNGEAVIKNNDATFLAFLSNPQTGHQLYVPVTRYDFNVYQAFDASGLLALASDTTRVITHKENGKKVVGKGFIKAG
jgi:hypothetical protein